MHAMSVTCDNAPKQTFWINLINIQEYSSLLYFKFRKQDVLNCGFIFFKVKSFVIRLLFFKEGVSNDYLLIHLITFMQ